LEGRKMKAIRNLKVILVVLIVILISAISFGGIYYVNKGRMTNRLPDYILGSNIKGYRHVTLVASEDTQENKNNTNSNTTENTANTTENTTNTTENTTNTTENTTNSVNTAENYRKSANILK
jgi:flagellar basal body-associated protein FliL